MSHIYYEGFNAVFKLCLGAYESLADLAVPGEEPEHSSFLLYKARALIALNRPEEAESLIPAGADSFPLKAARSLAKYVHSEDESVLEELRDLCVEVDGEENVSETEKWQVKVLAGTGFVRAGETEEALETLGVGTNEESLEAYVSTLHPPFLSLTFILAFDDSVSLVVQIYLSISRADLAKKEQTRALKWAEDDLLLQSIEATIGLATGSDGYQDCHAFFTEQLANPSLDAPHILVSRGVARLLRGDVSAAKSDLEEVMKSRKGGEEALGASVVAAGLGTVKKGEADELYE